LSGTSSAIVSIFTRTEPDDSHEYLSAPSLLPLVHLLNRHGFRYIKTNLLVPRFATHTFKRGGLSVVLHYFASNSCVGWEIRNPVTEDVAACGSSKGQLASALKLWIDGARSE
jgi:hypothetical protein